MVGHVINASSGNPMAILENESFESFAMDGQGLETSSSQMMTFRQVNSDQVAMLLKGRP
jgi:hypothetical protein